MVLHYDTLIHNGIAQPLSSTMNFLSRRSASLLKFVFVFYSIKAERVGIKYTYTDWLFLSLVIQNHNTYFLISPFNVIIRSMLLLYTHFKSVLLC